MINKLKIMIGLALTIAMLPSCTPVTAVSSTVAGITVAKESSAGTVLDDTIITANIKNDFVQTEVNELLSRISVNTNEGRVMLTGSVNDRKYAVEAIKIAWNTKGVKEVINEVEISQKGPETRAKDAFIEAQIKGKYLVEKNLASVNYTVDVNNAKVYVLGIAQSQNELSRALTIASEVNGVEKVVSHVTLKDDPRRANAVFGKKKVM